MSQARRRERHKSRTILSNVGDWKRGARIPFHPAGICDYCSSSAIPPPRSPSRGAGPLPGSPAPALSPGECYPSSGGTVAPLSGPLQPLPVAETRTKACQCSGCCHWPARFSIARPQRSFPKPRISGLRKSRDLQRRRLGTEQSRIVRQQLAVVRARISGLAGHRHGADLEPLDSSRNACQLCANRVSHDSRL